MAVWSPIRVSQMTPDLRWDSEHYRPEYLNQERALSEVKSVALSSAANISDGNHLSIAEEFCDEGVRYLRGQDLSDFFISDSDPIYIPEKFYPALVRSHMHPGDVLLGIVGTIGTVALVTDKYRRLTGNCKLAIIRSKGLPGEYIATYLASSLGQNEIARRIRGAVQMGLILPDIKELPIIDPPSSVLKKVVSLVKGAYDAKKQSTRTIEDAQKRIMEALSLDHLDLNTQKSYSRNFSDLQSATRFGAEYFMPCKQRVLNALAKMPHQKMIDLAPNIQLLWDPAEAAHGERVRNYDLSDALEPFLEDIPPQIGTEVGSTKKRMQNGDVVISRLRSYLKEIAVVRTSDNIPTVGSSEFIVLRPQSGGISAETLMVYLRCPLVQTVLKWSQDGSNHPRFHADDLVAIPVPDTVLKAQSKIDALVKKSREQRSESLDLLAQAKQTVEDMITSTSARKGR